MFLPIYYEFLGRSEEEAVNACYHYAEAFTERFHSLRCYDLRPGGFQPTAPPHMCENLTCEAVKFAYEYVSIFNITNEKEQFKE